MKINNELNVDDLPGVMHRQVTMKQILFGIFGVAAGIIVMLVMKNIFHVPTNYSCYVALPVVFIIVFAGAVNFNGYSGFGWLVKQREIRAGTRIFYYSSREDSSMNVNDGKESE